MPKITFVTATPYPSITADDALTAAALAPKNIQVEAAPWDDPSIDWHAFEAIVLRSCWNYHLHPDAFLQWLQSLPANKLINPLPAVKWNVHKSYLQDLQKAGAKIPDTIWIPKGQPIDVVALLQEKEWSRAVAKPAISATAHQTFHISLSDVNQWQPRLLQHLSKADYLLQPFLHEVQQAGEWSLLFFDKAFSHAVLKKPQPNDFRVQNDFGGTTVAAHPPAFVVHKAEEILASVPYPLPYARVDGIVSSQEFILMELELIEPSLFLAYHAQAAERLAQALQRKLSMPASA
ncbi:MAG: ATP-grasp domain-containing protein [Bacteroidota bacterium]